MRRSKRRRLAREKRSRHHIQVINRLWLMCSIAMQRGEAQTFAGFMRRRAEVWRAGLAWGDDRFQRRESRACLRTAEWAESNADEVWRILVDLSIGLPRPKPAPGSLTWSMTATLTHVSGPDLFDVLVPQHGHGSSGGEP